MKGVILSTRGHSWGGEPVTDLERSAEAILVHERGGIAAGSK